MAIEIRPFTPADIAEALALWQRTEGMGLFGETPAFLAACIERNPGLSFVAREGGALVGAVLGTCDGRRGFVQHLAVDAAHRRRGAGSRLVDACVAGFARLGLPRCHLFVQRGNDAAVEFWRHAGWAERNDLVMMSRTLVRETGGA